MSIKPNPWIVRRAPRNDAPLRLICFPHAGASALIYHEWHTAFPASIDVCAIEPPGRLTRRADPAINDMATFVAAAERAIDPLLDRPFAFFGYSLGALLALECARAIRRRRQLQPEQLIVAAAKAPQLPRRYPPIGHEPNAKFLRELEQRYGAFEPVLKSDPELLELLLEVMRGDLVMLENHRHQEEEPLRCPVLAIGGSQDVSVSRAELEGWSAHTSAAFRLEQLPGGHFFLRNCAAQLRSLVIAQLEPAAAGSAAAQL